MTALWERLGRTKGWRAWSRYGSVRGNVLAGGIAYFAFFSFFPALALAFTVLGLVAGNRLDLQQRIVDYVNSTMGGQTILALKPSGKALVSIDQLVRGDVLTVVGVLGLVGALFTGLGWIGALRDGLSAVFGRVHGPNVVLAKLGDLVALVCFGAAALASMAGSLLVTTGTGLVLDWVGLSRGTSASMLVNVLSSLLLLMIDTALFLLLFRLLAGVRLPVEDVFTGALAGGVALGLLKVLGGVVLRSASGNRFFAAFVIVAGLLLWMNLAARVGLLAAAWAATTAEDRGHLPPIGSAAAAKPAAGAAAGAAAHRPQDRVPVLGVQGTPTYSERAADRTVLLAGAVLGVSMVVAARAVAGAGGTLRDALRPRPLD